MSVLAAGPQVKVESVPSNGMEVKCSGPGCCRQPHLGGFMGVICWCSSHADARIDGGVIEWFFLHRHMHDTQIGPALMPTRGSRVP